MLVPLLGVSEDPATTSGGTAPIFLDMHVPHVFRLFFLGDKALMTVDVATLEIWISRVLFAQMSTSIMSSISTVALPIAAWHKTFDGQRQWLRWGSRWLSCLCPLASFRSG